MDGRNTIVSFGTGRFSGTFAVSFRECTQACWGMLLVSYLASLKIQNPKPVQTKSDKKLSEWFLTPYILTQFLAKSYLCPLLREEVNIIITPKNSHVERKTPKSSSNLFKVKPNWIKVLLFHVWKTPQNWHKNSPPSLPLLGGYLSDPSDRVCPDWRPPRWGKLDVGEENSGDEYRCWITTT